MEALAHPLWTGILLSILAFGPVLHFLGNEQSVYWRRIAVLAMIALIARYMFWRMTVTVPWGHSDSAAVYMQVIAVIELAWLLEMIHSYMFFWAPSGKPLRSGHLATVAASLDAASIDVFIPTYNEGREILERTIMAARRIRWDGAVTVSVLDDGGRPWVGEACRRLGARWITRPDNRGAKAGNVNHALQHTDAEFILVLDADFLAHPHAIRRLMPAMSDPAVGVAQAAQHFYNQDPIARALGTEKVFGDDQRLFFDRILPARDRGGYAFFCGTCALVRRCALEEIGGLPSGSVTEDILLSVHLRQCGYQTRFVNTRVATGLAAETLHAFFVQRCRWAKGAIQMLYLRTGLLSPRLSLRERVAFLPVYWIFSPIVRIASLAIPQLYLLLAWVPLENATVSEIVKAQGPLLVAMIALPAFFYPRRWSPLVNFVWADVISIRLIPNVLRDVVMPFGDTRFHVTPKGRSAGGRGVTSEDWLGVAVAAGVVFTLMALIAGPFGRWDDPYVSVSMFWAALNLVRLLAVLAVVWSNPPAAGDPKVEIRCGKADRFALLSEAGEQRLDSWWIGEDRIRPPSQDVLVPAGKLARLGVRGRISILAHVQPGGALHFASAGARANLLSAVVAIRVDEHTPFRPVVAVARVAGRMFGFSRSGQ
jgi:cellulose synthase (UDP-forming)